MIVQLDNKTFAFRNAKVNFEQDIIYYTYLNTSKALNYSFLLNFLLQIIDLNIDIPDNKDKLIEYINDLFEYVKLTHNPLSKLALYTKLAYIIMNDLIFESLCNYKYFKKQIIELNDNSDAYSALEFILHCFKKKEDITMKDINFNSESYNFTVLDFIYDYYE